MVTSRAAHNDVTPCPLRILRLPRWHAGREWQNRLGAVQRLHICRKAQTSVFLEKACGMKLVSTPNLDYQCDTTPTPGETK